MSNNYEQLIEKIQKWSMRQIDWLDTQIKMVKYVKETLEKGDLEALQELVEIKIQNNKDLETLIQEYGIIIRELDRQGISKDKLKNLIVPIKEKITQLINLNEELIKYYHTNLNKLKSEILDFHELKNRFLGYSPQQHSDAEFLDYDI